MSRAARSHGADASPADSASNSAALVRAFMASRGSARLVRGSSGRHPAAVAFPCALACTDLQLSSASTLFFVIKPLAFEPGDQAVGQRFFGHYPFGQFRFRDGRVALRSDASECAELNTARQ